ncbi:MAG: GntR family transcriptional regulator [Cryomorphaceae bacterium]|jgi:GntR family transcriptional regulator
MSLSTNFQPLYKQVYDLLVSRLVDGHWKPSAPLPSEHALAAEFGVSQGTVRKALNQMVAENLLQRRQGKGTYVAEHTQESSLFRFFRFREPGGESMVPETKVVSSHCREANAQETEALSLGENEQVVEMVRVRSLNAEPTILEHVIQPLSIFPGIDQEQQIPNSLYTLYQEKYGISIVEVKEELRATVLNDEQAKILGAPAGTPALLVERSSINIDGRVAEWSVAVCITNNFVYSVSLR